MKFTRQVLTSSLNFSDSGSDEIKIGETSFWIIGMELALTLAKSDGASPTTTQDFFARPITSLSLASGDYAPFISINSPNLRGLYWHERMKNQGRLIGPAMAAGSVSLRWLLPIMFGVNPVKVDDNMNVKDVTAAIKPSADLTLSVNWSAAGSTTATGGVLGDYRAIGAGTKVRATLFGVDLEAGDTPPAYMPHISSTNWQPDQNFSGYDGIKNLDTGFLFRRSTVLVRNGAAPADVRTDGLNANAISQIGLFAFDGRPVLKQQFVDFVRHSQSQFAVADDNAALAQSGGTGATAAYGTPTVACGYNPGVGMIDWLDFPSTSAPAGMKPGADPLYGIDMRGKDKGAVKIGFTVDTNTNTNVDLIHEAYLPY